MSNVNQLITRMQAILDLPELQKPELTIVKNIIKECLEELESVNNRIENIVDMLDMLDLIVRDTDTKIQ